MKKKLPFLFVLFFIPNFIFSQVKILFDATKAETAANADWTIDADVYNVGFGGGNPSIGGSGTEANPQRFPTPAQSIINTSTTEGFWKGGLSAWGIDCVKKGYQVETLPIGSKITFNDATNPQDLSNYKVFIVCEPNIAFNTIEKNAIKNFVQNGGGLMMIADHDGSDRNFDGIDSPSIWNDLMTTFNNPFGMTFDLVDISEITTNIPNLPNDPILNGSFGNVSKTQFSGGATLTLDPSKNPSVKGIVYKKNSAFGNTNAMVAYATFGTGRVGAIGDSSPADDGTGDLNDILYDGWIADASGNHQKLIMNATVWLASSTITYPPIVLTSSKQDVKCFSELTGSATVSSSGGTGNFTYKWNNNSTSNSISNLAAGTYTVTVTSGTASTSTTVTILQPTSALSITTTPTNITCTITGKIIANAIGGTPSYTYKWSDGTTTSTILPTKGAVYTLTATDKNGCSASIATTISENKIAPTIPQMTTTTPSCGTICLDFATPTGKNYTYKWSDGILVAKNCIKIVPPNFMISVTDVANGCSSSQPIIATIAPLLAATIVKTSLETNAQKNGSATISINGGTSPYSYTWKNANNIVVGTMQNLSNVSAGTYTCTIKDAVGCLTTLSVEIKANTSIDEILEQEQLDVDIFPNPTNATFYIKMKNIEVAKISIFDNTGKKLFEKECKNEEIIDISAYPSAFYILKASNQKGDVYKKIGKL